MEDVKSLEQMARALSLVGINISIPIMYAIVQTQKRLQEKGDDFSIKDAEEIQQDFNAKFPQSQEEKA